MRQLLASLVAACACVAVFTSASAAATARCRTSDYAMQCNRVTHGSVNAGLGNPLAQPARRVRAAAYAYGIDFGWRSVRAWSARHMGARFAASYLSRDPSKNWTRKMINSYHAAGLGTVCVWETAATRALAGYAAGHADARAARAQEQALGVPTSKPIYFAVDFDETPREARAVASYFRGVDSVLGVKRTGGYGGYWTISRLFNSGLIRFGWQTSGWSGGRWDPRAQLRQYAYHRAYDWNRAVAPAYGATF